MKALQKREDFQKALSGKTRLNVKRLAQAIVEPAGQPVGEHPGVGASFFECTCMAALADQIQKSVGRSVLDLQICPDMVFAATHGQPHRGYWEGGEAERGLLIGVVG